MLTLLLAIACKPPPAIEGDPCGDAFDPSTVATIELELSSETEQALEDDFLLWEDRWRSGEEVKPYHPVESFTYKCQTVRNAMIRLKGNPCCSWDGVKPQYTVSFNQVDRSGRFQQLRKIALDAPFYDPGLLRERLAYAAFEDMGQEASRVNHVRLDINGEYRGLYANIEVMDKEWLQRRRSDEDSEGTLWKLDYLDAEVQPRTNEDTADRDRWRAFITAGSLTQLAPLMDIEHSLGSIAAEAIVNQSDGYWAGGVNWYVYDHPRLGFQVLPWDLDNTYDRWPPGVDPARIRDTPYYPTAPQDVLLRDPAMRQTYIDIVARRNGRIDPEVLEQRVEDWDRQIRPHLEEDPLRPYDMDTHDEAVRALIRSTEERWSFIENWADEFASPELP